MLGKPSSRLCTSLFALAGSHSSPSMLVSNCSVAAPPDPVATVMAQENVRHGETVFSEAGISNSGEVRCQDTGIQLAAAPPSVPGTLLTTVCAVIQFNGLLAEVPPCCSCVQSKESSQLLLVCLIHCHAAAEAPQTKFGHRSAMQVCSTGLYRRAPCLHHTWC